MTLTLTDLFCGAGGSSTGAVQVPGVQVRMAANHWQLAVDTHQANHPAADHACADVSQVDPRYFPATDLLWASPECTNHSIARGVKRNMGQLDLLEDPALPVAAGVRSRATMWDVVRFTEHHRYAAVIVENVVDAYQWAPFGAWLMAMDCLGYAHQIVFLNSMHAQAGGAPAPQSRDRMYVVFHRTGYPAPDVTGMQRPLAWCPGCDQVVAAVQAWKHPTKRAGRYRAQYVYRCPRVSCRNTVVEPGWLPASTAIDWTLPGHRIGDRTRPLAPKTRARIAAGIARYWTQPLTVQPLTVPVDGRTGTTARPVTTAMRTQTTRLETALALPAPAHPGLGRPAFVAELRGGGSNARAISDPLATVTAGGNHHGLVVPAGGTWNTDARPTTDPLRTRTTRESDALITPYYGTSTATTTATPLPTVTTIDRHALLMRTITAHGNHGHTTTPDSTDAPDNAAAPAISAAAVDDVLFRMLEPHEVIAAMAFPTTYTVLGTRRERVRMAGNAVTPPAARDLITAVAHALNHA